MKTVKQTLTFSFVTRATFFNNEESGLLEYGGTITEKIPGKLTFKDAKEHVSNNHENCAFVDVQHTKETIEVPADAFYKLAITPETTATQDNEKVGESVTWVNPGISENTENKTDAN